MLQQLLLHFHRPSWIILPKWFYSIFESFLLVDSLNSPVAYKTQVTAKSPPLENNYNFYPVPIEAFNCRIQMTHHFQFFLSRVTVPCKRVCHTKPTTERPDVYTTSHPMPLELSSTSVSAERFYRNVSMFALSMCFTQSAGKTFCDVSRKTSANWRTPRRRENGSRWDENRNNRVALS